MHNADQCATNGPLPVSADKRFCSVPEIPIPGNAVPYCFDKQPFVSTIILKLHLLRHRRLCAA